jgi:hypothetical protein
MTLEKEKTSPFCWTTGNVNIPTTVKKTKFDSTSRLIKSLPKNEFVEAYQVSRLAQNPPHVLDEIVLYVTPHTAHTAGFIFRRRTNKRWTNERLPTFSKPLEERIDSAVELINFSFCFCHCCPRSNLSNTPLFAIWVDLFSFRFL